MKRYLLPALCLLLLMLSGSNLLAEPITITDQYVGAADHNWGDVVGAASVFDISKMTVDFSGGTLKVDVYTNYVKHIGESYTSLGDLFISTDGWTPYGTAPYKYDDASNGEGWEYALVLNTHLPSNGVNSGAVYLYKIDGNGHTVLSSGPSGWTWRNNQEVQYVGSDSIAMGTWSIDKSPNNSYLEFILPNYASFLPSSMEYGFKWGMTCANDTIEGSAPLPNPEPGSLILMGTGIAALAFAFRRKKK